MSFKALKKLKIKDDEPESSCDEKEDESDQDSEGEIVPYFTRRYKKGSTNSKRGGKSTMALRCYRCGLKGHFGFKCKVNLEEKDEDSDEESSKNWSNPANSSRKATNKGKSSSYKRNTGS